MKTSKLIIGIILIAFTLSSASCARSKCAALDSGDVKVSKRKKPTKGLFSKKELRHKKW